MSIEATPEDPRMKAPAAAEAPAELVPWCSYCGTDEFLIIESVENSTTADAAEFLEISYTCGECDRFYGHPVRHSPLWARRAVSEPSDTEYLHCGEPMQPKDSRTISLSEPLSTEHQNAVPSDVRLETSILRCSCGFQIELPA
ncbi:hypothetical protein H9639_07135 [Arthrobacter sp. Sa2CUA1]|uniref:Uncharacterized protein n=1 Tax=Arthrobacter gallicola TaxID=2762225 RepID=A0ABR8UR76_9MICC|nr:hypothetical protein [Arthrobacter gallicola]MBD7995067.1 hypothetical protein [Arthrobacter gallicola]